MRSVVLAVLSLILFNISANFQNSVTVAPSGISANSTSAPSIIITNFSTRASEGVNARLPLTVVILNKGQLATGNITINLRIIGVNNLTTRIPVGPLSPGQNESVIVYLHNVTGNAGTSIAYVNASYYFNNLPYYSNNQSVQYSIVPVQALNFTKTPTNQISSTPYFAITYAPLFTSIQIGQNLLSRLEVQNTANKTEYVNFSISKNISQFLTLSTNTAYLKPSQRIGVQLLFKAPPTVKIARYPIQINVTASATDGTKVSAQEYMLLQIYDRLPNEPLITTQTALTNYSNTAVGTIQISSPQSASIANASLDTVIPISVAGNVSQIAAAGLPSNISVENNAYEISWNINLVSPGQTTYVYYTVNGISNQKSLLGISNLFIDYSMLRLQNLLKINNIFLPTFYTQSKNMISMKGIYTGTTMQPVTITLSGPIGTSIYNATKVINAAPNQQINQTFQILTNQNPGTLIFNLNILTQGLNSTYVLPVLMLQNPNAVQQQQQPFSLNLNSNALIIITFIAVAVLILYAIGRLKNRSRYRPERARYMMNIKEQINRMRDEFG